MMIRNIFLSLESWLYCFYMCYACTKGIIDPLPNETGFVMLYNTTVPCVLCAIGFGALPLSIAVGVFFALFTFIFTFYDSDVPGNFPPTPVSPRSLKNSG